jgi:hypothetical protein
MVWGELPGSSGISAMFALLGNFIYHIRPFLPRQTFSVALLFQSEGLWYFNPGMTII